MVIEELLKLFVGEVDAELLEAVELLETKEGKSRTKQKTEGKRQLSLMLLTSTKVLQIVNGDSMSSLSLSFRTWRTYNLGGDITWARNMVTIAHKLHVFHEEFPLFCFHVSVCFEVSSFQGFAFDCLIGEFDGYYRMMQIG